VSPSRPSQCSNTSGASIGVGRAPGGGRMTVHCEGDCRLLEPLGEKQAFEAELSRLGFRHQDFILHVLRQMSENQSAESNQSYSVTVTNVLNERSQLYQGGSGQRWVAQFSRHLANGTYGDPAPSGRANSDGADAT
jgi:hypothetical protein